MKDKTCQYCYHAKEATASSRTILICNHKEGSEAKFFVVAPNDTCANFKATKTPPSPESDGAKLIPLTQGRFATVDPDDYDWLSTYRWYCQQEGNRFYAFRREGKSSKKIRMHREIMEAPKGKIVDHIDRDGLNNRKSNLRLCTQAENACNRPGNCNGSSRYKGVSWYKPYRRWQVKITYKGKNIHLGRFDDETEAALAYDRKAEELFGEFAYLNFPQ